MDQVVINFDKQLNDCTQILKRNSHLIKEQLATFEKLTEFLLFLCEDQIEQELRTNIGKLKQQIPQLEQMVLDISRNTIRYKITKQESEKRVNQFQFFKSQFIQQEQAAFATQRRVENSVQQQQQALFQGRNNDIEMQDMSAYELQQRRANIAQKENKALDETNELLESLINKQKQVGNLMDDSNQKLDHITKRADQVTQKMETMSDKFENLLRTTSNNTLWIIIIINIFILVFLISL